MDLTLVSVAQGTLVLGCPMPTLHGRLQATGGGDQVYLSPTVSPGPGTVGQWVPN
jgi:hypothetical protein